MATHFSIVPADGAMTVDGQGMGGIDFTSANIPAVRKRITMGRWSRRTRAFRCQKYPKCNSY